MKNFLKTYKSSILMLLGIIVGAIIGLVFKEKAEILKPLGTIFLNLMLVMVVPLIALTLTVSMGKMKEPKRLGKILKYIVVIFVITSLVSVLIGFVVNYNIDLVAVADKEALAVSLDLNAEVEEQEEMNILEATANVLTVNDFTKLLSTQNVMALVVIAILAGIAINMSKEKGEKLLQVLESANEVVLNMIKLIMVYAPIGLGAYFAVFVGTLGVTIVAGYLKAFVVYLLISIFLFVVVYSIYALIAGGKRGFKTFWSNIFPVLAVSLSTCSSVASIPVNVATTKKIGVSNDVAEMVVPLGVTFHKDGSIIGSVMKTMFLVSLFGATFGVPGVFEILLISLIATLLIVGVPIGGGTISEVLIISMLGYPMAVLPLLTIVATIIDAPATVLNVSGDTASSMLVARCVDGKEWMGKN